MAMDLSIDPKLLERGRSQREEGGEGSRYRGAPGVHCPRRAQREIVMSGTLDRDPGDDCKVEWVKL